jgi:hypothetical protein
MSYYLLFLFALPLLFNTQFVLDVWLKDVPEHTVSFAQLLLVFALLESLARPMITALRAEGNIKDYQIIVGGLQLLNLPVSYLLLKLGCMAEIIVVVSIVISLVCVFVRLLMLNRKINFPVKDFVVKVLVNVLKVTVVAVMLPLAVCRYIPDTLVGGLASLALVFVSALLTIAFVGCTQVERKEIISMIRSKF